MYPTKEQIIENIEKNPPHPVDTAIILEWKKQHYINRWSKIEVIDKQEALNELINDLARWHDSVIEGIIWDDDIEKEWGYNPQFDEIYGGPIPSIISALHEFGHAISITSNPNLTREEHDLEAELQACTYSIGLFQKCFPLEYNNLTWNGHLLVKA